MRKYHKITPEGTKDLLFEECLTHRYVERTLADVFSSHGFHEVITPGLEFYDVFDTESSGIGQEVMYKMSDKRRAFGLHASRFYHAYCQIDSNQAAKSSKTNQVVLYPAYLLQQSWAYRPQ